MTVAITARGRDLDAELDAGFGRAPFFVVVDSESERFSVHDNRRNIDLVGRAGVSAAGDIVRLGVNALITERVGPRTFAVLKAGRVDVYVGASGHVADAWGQFRRGELERISAPTVQDHWTHVLDL